MPFEIRLHGRGGQGGVTCAKILAALYSRLGKSVQAFGDYAGERSGAPVRAYTRVDEKPITNRNKVYRPDHVLVLDPTLLGADAVAGLGRGGLLLVNTSEPLQALEERFPDYRVAAIDATGIARRHGIGSRSVVIVNTTMAGAYARALDLPLGAVEDTYGDLKLSKNFPAAREAYDAVAVGRPREAGGSPRNGSLPAKGPDVLPLTQHTAGAPTGLKTGSWRTQAPRYVEGLAPCNAHCPAGNDVVGFVQAVARGDEAEAARILGATQPFPSICGRVCPAPCMEGCNRRRYDGAVNIRALERWIGDRAPSLRDGAVAVATGRKVAIVGSGPAGLAAAADLARAGHGVTVYEGEQELGGVLRTGIPAYRLPREVLDREIESILGLGVEVRRGTFLTSWAVADLMDAHDAVVLAAGFGLGNTVDAPGADLDGIEEGTKFLHRVNLGDGARLSGHVLVLGGGNTAMDCARSALRSGAVRVTVAYRRTRSDMPALREEIEEAAHEGVEFLFQRQVVRFHGRMHVHGVDLAEVDLGEPDASGRRRPVVTDRTSRLGCDFVLLGLGQSAERTLLPPGSSFVNGRMRTVRGAATNLFVAGDYHTAEGTVAHAIGDGHRAARRVRALLGEPVAELVRPDPATVVPAERVRMGYFVSTPPAQNAQMLVPERLESFAETDRGISDPREAERCFSCGHCTFCDTCLAYCPEGIIRRERIESGGYVVDLDFCKGCGVCVAECPRGAIEMVPA
jgi:2-oxoacid:acceptor oxidoreductase gamma subunit (pyruvate/2-ketoisovalerate family)